MSKEDLDFQKQDEIQDKIDEQIEEEVKEVQEDNENEVQALKNQIQELQEKYLRAAADFENIKKRLEKEKIQAIEYSNEVFSRDLLPIVDTLEAALKVDESKEENIIKQVKDGVLNTKELLLKTLEKHGITHIKSDNEEFNPELHNAISLVEQEGVDKNKVVQTYQKGYQYKNRVLRPAMVVVSK